MEKWYYMKDLMEYFGVSRDAIRYYEEQGLLSAERDGNGYRRFSPVMFEKLDWILRLRGLDFSTKEIKATIANGKMHDDGNRIFHERIREVDRQIRRLEDTRRKLVIEKEFSESFQSYYRNCHRYDWNPRCCLPKRSGRLLLLDEGGRVIREEVFHSCIGMGDCVKMGEAQKAGGDSDWVPAIRTIIKQQEAAELPEVIRGMLRFGKAEGYVPDRRVFCFAAYYFEKDDRDGLALDLYIPILNARSQAEEREES